MSACQASAVATLGCVDGGWLSCSNIAPSTIGSSAGIEPSPVGLVDGNAAQILNQLIGVGITIALATLGSFVLLRIVDAIIGLRVSEAAEVQGLDVSEHGVDDAIPALEPIVEGAMFEQLRPTQPSVATAEA